VVDSTLSANSADDGGAIFNSGTLSVIGSTFSRNLGRIKNQGEVGSAITNWGQLTMINSTLSDNGGFAIYNAGNAKLISCTFSKNGGAISNRGESYCGGNLWCGPGPPGVATLTNTIVAESVRPNCEGHPITDGGNNLQFPGTSCGDTIPSRDPLLDPAGLKDNGGPTQTIALLPGSPGIDAGDNVSCPGADQRAVSRPFGAACDLGAYEWTGCGNGRTDSGEQCDDGNVNPDDGCTNVCTICGNRVIAPPEQCDDGNRVNGDGCEADCTLPRCGNGIVDAGEQCDDGNANACDGCSPSCTTEPLGAVCGDGVVSASCGEQCDAGGESATCDTDCTTVQCGDGTVNVTAGEECDDGNRSSFDGCTKDCTVCGNGAVTPPEECDDGDTISGANCDAQCRQPRVVGSGSPDSCTEAAFDAALAQRSVIFNCGPAPATITITSEKVITANTSIDGGDGITLSGGGAVRIFRVEADGAEIQLRNLTIADGHSGGHGGSILNNGGTLALTNCTLSGNSVDYPGSGAAIASWGTLTLTNCTLSCKPSNLVCISNYGTATLTNCTLSGYTAGGIGGFGNTTLTNTLVANIPLANPPSEGDCSGRITDGGHNLIEDARYLCGLENGVNGNLIGVDPLLDSDLKYNGGPTQTIALLPDSPAINAGDPDVCANLPVNGVDQRGHTRPGAASANCSIGAFESDYPAPPCTGDCDGVGGVTIDEIVTLVNIALGTTSVAQCSSGDANGDSEITVDEILTAVNRALNGCGGS